MKPATFNLAILVSILIGAAIGISAGMMKHAQAVKRMETAGSITVVNADGKRFYQRCDNTGRCINSFDKGNLSDAMILRRTDQ